MLKLICRILKEISRNSNQNRLEKLSLLQNQTSNLSSSLMFYQDDILERHASFENQFTFLRNYFFSRIEWVYLRLFFKRLYLFQTSIKVLKIRHLVKNWVKILNNQIKKIATFSILIDKTEVCVFLRIINITHK